MTFDSENDDSLVGQTIRFDESLGLLFFVCVAAVPVLAVFAVTERAPHFAFAAVWPVCYCLMRFFWRRSKQEMVFLEDGVRIEPSGVEASYESILGLKLNNRTEPWGKDVKGLSKLELVADGDVLFTGRSTGAGRAYDFLLGMVPTTGSRTVSPRLTRHLEEQLASFDDDLVASFDARPVIGCPRPGVLQTAMTLLLAAAILCGLAVVHRQAIGWAVACGFVGSILLWVGTLVRDSGVRPQGMTRWMGSCIIVSPTGIAVEQGDLVGKMRWDEIRKLECAKPLRASITVTISGANFLIHDLYDRPLAVIYERMLDFWEADEIEESAA